MVGGAYAWDYTNSPVFCGTACHTMPPEYTSYLTSPHARVDCVECHIGRDFIATRISRKAGDVRHIFATLFVTYEFPIRAHNMRPARDTCERCHFPEKFADDSLRELKLFESDQFNTPTSLYLVMKTGGGSERMGLGRGIHWHIENQVLLLPAGSRARNPLCQSGQPGWQHQ
jgi:nitrate/TMAO reductase-like tetraheme cytochrome c subunit